MPFHMVDRIDEFERGVSIKARKLTSTGEDIWTQSTQGLEMRAGWSSSRSCRRPACSLS